MSDRVSWLLEVSGLTLTEFGECVGRKGRGEAYGKSYISKLASGDNTNPGLEFFTGAVGVFGVRRDWIERGDGDAGVDGETIRKLAERLKRQSAEGRYSAIPVLSEQLELSTEEARTLTWIIGNSTDETIDTFVAEAMRQKRREIARVILGIAERTQRAISSTQDAEDAAASIGIAERIELPQGSPPKSGAAVPTVRKSAPSGVASRESTVQPATPAKAPK